MQESKTLHYILGISLVMIAVFVVASLVMINSQAGPTNMTLGVNNDAPTVTSEFLSNAANTNSNFWGGNINTMVAGTGADVWVNGVITDLNGYADVTKVVASVALSTDGTLLSYSKPSITNCTPNQFDCLIAMSDGGSPLCSLYGGSGNTVNYSCQFHLPYYFEYTNGGANSAINAQTYKWQVLAIDAANDGSSISNVDKELNAYLGLAIPNNVNFGNKSLGSVGDTSVGGEDQPIANKSNDTQDAYISATDMTCSGLGSIPVANIQYGVGVAGEGSDVGYGGSGMVNYINTASTDIIELNLDPQTNGSSKQVMWRNEITVPSSGVKGSCAGTVTVAAKTNR